MHLSKGTRQVRTHAELEMLQAVRADTISELGTFLIRNYAHMSPFHIFVVILILF
jgi:hypothetical protein